MKDGSPGAIWELSTLAAEWHRTYGGTLEPVSGFEPLACRLQEVRPPAPYALAAPTAHVIALRALAALGLSGAPFHEPFHAGGGNRSSYSN